jgi:hypothetical protein
MNLGEFTRRTDVELTDVIVGHRGTASGGEAGWTADTIKAWVLSQVDGRLSTATINTRTLLGEAGGAGYLDGIATVGQATGCVVQMFISSSVPPQQWILLASTENDSLGAVCRPLDYSDSNRKAWFRIL